MTNMDQFYDELLLSLRGEFADEADDQLNMMEVLLSNIEAGVEGGEEALVKIRRPVHSLKGSSSVAEYPIITTIMHRLEDYLSGVTILDKQHLYDIGKYIELSRQYIHPEIDQGSISTADLVRELPQKRQDAEAEPVKLKEAMLVSRDKVTGRFIERELMSHAMHVVTVSNPMEALQMAIHTQPDVFITSGELDGTLSGFDLVRALSAMNSTQEIWCVVVTGYTEGHPALEGLDDTIAVIHKNGLSEDLAAILS